MNKTYERINWENEPSIATPLGATNLNKIDYAVNEIDNRVINLDSGKANQTDELLDIKSVAYNATTGVWTFTHQNGTVDTFDQNIEKIPVTFSMDANGVITMTTADGTTYTCDVGTLIKTYTFVNSGNISFTVTTDSSGNKSVTANVIDGSITRQKLDPDYLAQIDVDVAAAAASALSASGSANTASSKALDSEAYAIGTRGGVPVTSEDPAYENNSKYYAEHGASSLVGLTDTNISNPTNGQVLKYDANNDEWINDDESGGLLPHLIIIADEGSTTTVVKDGITITPTETSTGHFECDVPEFGTYTIHSVKDGDDAVVSLVVDTVKVYTVDDTHFHADITVTYPSGATCSCSKTGETTMYATGSPYTFTVHTAGTWTLTCTKDGETWTKTVNITTSGQTLNILLTPDGTTATANDVELWLYCAGIFDSTDETLADVLADTSALINLMNNENAVDYLVRSTDWVSTICASSDGMSAIGSSDDASESLIADSTWGTAIWNSTYVENVMNVHVPAMGSNISPNGVVSDYRQVATAYNGFDGDTTTYYSSEMPRTTSDFLQYDFIAPVVVNKVVVKRYNSTDLSKILIKGSNDGKTFTNLTEQITINTDVQTIDLNNTTPYRFYRLQADDSHGSYFFRINELQFLGRNKGGVQTWLRKAGITNKNYVTLDELLADTTTVNTLLTDTDAVDYLVTCKIFAKNICASSIALDLVGLHNYCSNTLISDEDWAIAIANSDYAEEVFNILVPTMSNNTTPSGECSAYRQNADAYKAFDKSQSTCYSSNAGQVVGDYLQYQFPNAKDIKIAKVFRHGDSDLKQFVIQGSNDGTNWTDISALVTLNDYNVADKVKIVPLFTNIAYSYYRIQNMYTASTSNYFAIDEAQFYGREDV